MSLGSRLGRYEILGLIGRGAMGAVYKARDPAIDRLVAVKTVGGALSVWADHQDEFFERFRREARAAGRLTHPHIVSVYDLGVEEASETPFIVMEYVAGVSLSTLLKENPVLPVEQALEIVEQIASALEEAHQNGVVHRDIKPANIFLDQRGRVKVGDFGIARLEGSELTQTGVGLGTPGYLAPELLRGAAADARTDLFALGVVAYQLLTGKKPFAEPRGGAPLAGDATEALAPRVLRGEVPEQASRAVMRCLSERPSDRPQSAAAFLKELRDERGGLEATATIVQPASSPRFGRRTVVLGGTALVLGGLGGLALLSNRGEPVASAPPTPAATTPTRAAPRPPMPSATNPAALPMRPVATPTPSPRREPKDAPEPRHGKARGKGHKKKGN